MYKDTVLSDYHAEVIWRGPSNDTLGGKIRHVHKCRAITNTHQLNLQFSRFFHWQVNKKSSSVITHTQMKMSYMDRGYHYALKVMWEQAQSILGQQWWLAPSGAGRAELHEANRTWRREPEDFFMGNTEWGGDWQPVPPWENGFCLSQEPHQCTCLGSGLAESRGQAEGWLRGWWGNTPSAQIVPPLLGLPLTTLSD